MPSMIELIRASAVPSNIVQSAAKGSLSMPAPEMVEILVYLANHNQVFADQARLTLAAWDEKSSRAIAADSKTPQEILDYMASPQNFRPVMLPALLGNPAISEAALAGLAAVASRENVDLILKSPRAEHSYAILKALHSNPHLSGIQAEQIKTQLSPVPDPVPSEPPPAEIPGATVADTPAEKSEMKSDESSAEGDGDDVLSEEIAAYFTEHAAEIAATEKPFQPIGGIHESLLDLKELDIKESEPAEPAAITAVAAPAGSSSAAAAAPAFAKKSALSVPEQRGSALQKISRLDVKGRIQLAMKGSKEERSILVRDGTRVVALGVLDSPKVTDSEVEKFAAQKNVLESLLRGISMKRRFMKNYNIVRNLVSNPRTPIDISLGLMKNLHMNDLKSISDNKDVSDTIRKLALKMYKTKKDASKR
jgi:hypothetical protein